MYHPNNQLDGMNVFWQISYINETQHNTRQQDKERVMKAIYIEQYGNADQLTLGELPKPEIADNQVLIKLHQMSA